MKRVKRNIVRALSQDAGCREDDVLLAFCVWEAEGLRLSDQQRMILSGLSKPGSIVRTRAHIQNVEGRFKPSQGRR
jgi:hypothetical protein